MKWYQKLIVTAQTSNVLLKLHVLLGSLFMCVAAVLKHFVKRPCGSQPILLALWIPIAINKKWVLS